jgi:simple sugar transport system substrate-binding protein
MTNRTLVGSTAAAAVFVLALAGCTAGGGGSETESGATGDNADIKICMYTHGDGGTFWAVVQKGAEDAASALGVTLDYQGSTNDSAKQASTIEAGVAGGCSAIAASAPDPGAIEDAMISAADGDIPTITINSGSAVFQDLGAFTHVGQDEIVAGQQAGERFNELGATKVLCPIQEAANSGLTDRCRGAAETFTGTIEEFNVDGALADLNGAQAKIRAALQADSSIDGVFGLNADVTTGAVLPAVEAVGNEITVGTVDLSGDALDAIRDGTLAFAVDQQQYAQGYLAVELLYLATKDAIELGGGLPMYTGPAFVTSDNVEAVQASVDAGTR